MRSHKWLKDPENDRVYYFCIFGFVFHIKLGKKEQKFHPVLLLSWPTISRFSLKYNIYFEDYSDVYSETLRKHRRIV